MQPRSCTFVTVDVVSGERDKRLCTTKALTGLRWSNISFNISFHIVRCRNRFVLLKATVTARKRFLSYSHLGC